MVDAVELAAVAAAIGKRGILGSVATATAGTSGDCRPAPATAELPDAPAAAAPAKRKRRASLRDEDCWLWWL